MTTQPTDLTKMSDLDLMEMMRNAGNELNAIDLQARQALIPFRQRQQQLNEQLQAGQQEMDARIAKKNGKPAPPIAGTLSAMDRARKEKNMAELARKVVPTTPPVLKTGNPPAAAKPAGKKGK